jgi:hypothetical protein
MQATNKERFMYVLAAIIIAGELAMISLIIYVWRWGAASMDPNIVNLVYALAMGFHSGFMLVLGYFFGSSKSSADKTELLSRPVEGVKQ